MNDKTPSQTLLLDFQFRSKHECILVTSSPFPFVRPGCIVAAFNASAFQVAGGLDVEGNLLYTIEKELGEWFDHSQRLSSPVAYLEPGVTEESIIFAVTKLNSVAQLHRAIELFINAATRLLRLNNASAEPETDRTGQSVG